MIAYIKLYESIQCAGEIMEYRLNKDSLLENLSGWNSFLKRKVHLVACGGTAMTLFPPLLFSKHKL